MMGEMGVIGVSPVYFNLGFDQQGIGPIVFIDQGDGLASSKR